ncbi:MAG: sulfur carrier protein ThiS [Synechococcus sp.]
MDGAPTMATLTLQVNGEQRTLDLESPTLAVVVEQLGYHPKLVVVEYNGLILTPERWATQVVQTADNLEIVTIVGGGS